MVNLMVVMVHFCFTLSGKPVESKYLTVTEIAVFIAIVIKTFRYITGSITSL